MDKSCLIYSFPNPSYFLGRDISLQFWPDKVNVRFDEVIILSSFGIKTIIKISLD